MLAAHQKSRDQTRQNLTQIRDRAGAQHRPDIGYRVEIQRRRFQRI
jgi:hypothetical protein